MQINIAPPKPTKAQRARVIGLAAIGVIWFAVVGAFLFWHFAPSPNFLGISTRAASEVGGQRPGSLGGNRMQVLLEATRVYREEQGEAVTAAATESRLAPVPVLNRALEEQGAKWRVRSTDGLEVDFYEVS